MHWWWHGNRYGPKEFNPDLSAGIGQAVQLDEARAHNIAAKVSNTKKPHCTTAQTTCKAHMTTTSVSPSEMQGVLSKKRSRSLGKASTSKETACVKSRWHQPTDIHFT